MKKKPRANQTKWHVRDKESILLLNGRTGALKVWARDWEGTTKGCIVCGDVDG